MNRFGILLMLFCFSISLNAQEFSYGFKVGLNFSTLLADSEVDANGNELESFKYNSGFHVGAAVIYRFTDLVGVKGEFLYNQRGVKYAYEGPGFQIFTDNMGNRILSANGNRELYLETVNSYLDIPLTVYYKIGEKFEIFGGVDVGFLVGSTAVGSYTYQGDIPGFPAFDDNFDLDYKYFSDKTASETVIDENTEVIKVMTNTRSITIPKELGAYYLDYPEKDGSFYNILDFGLTGGMAFYINSGLFISGTVNYGLVDATNDYYDISRVSTNGLEYIPRNDKDTNLSIQTSIGFSF
jgi:outer membrane protein with beta-barrel domain